MEVAIECTNKAMPVILTGEAGDAWLRAPIEEALALQRPAPDDLLRTVTGGDKAGDPAQAPAAGVCSRRSALSAGRGTGDGRLLMGHALRHRDVDSNSDDQQAEQDQPRPNQRPAPSLGLTVSRQRLGDDLVDIRVIGLHASLTRQPAPGCSAA